MDFVVVLDPQISYKGLKQDFKHDSDLLADLENMKRKLHEYYNTRYKSSLETHTSTIQLESEDDIPAAINGSPRKISFTARYQHQQTPILAVANCSKHT